MSGESSTTRRGTKQWYKTRLLDQASRGEYEQVRQTAIDMEKKHGHSWDTDYYKYSSSDALGHVDDAKNMAHHIVTQHNYPNVFDHPYLITQACVRMAELGKLADAKPIVQKLKDSILTGTTPERKIELQSVLTKIGTLESQIEKEITRKKDEQAERKKEKKKRVRRKELQPTEKAHGESMEGATIEMATEEADEVEKGFTEGATAQDESKTAQELYRHPPRIEMGPHCHILVESKDSEGIYHGKKIWYESMVEFVSMLPMSDLNEALTTFATLKELEADFVLKCHGIVDSPADNSVKLLVVQRIFTMSPILMARYHRLKLVIGEVLLSTWWSHIRDFYHQFARVAVRATLALIQKNMSIGKIAYITHKEQNPKFIPSRGLNLREDAKCLSTFLDRILIFCSTLSKNTIDMQLPESEHNYLTELMTIKRNTLIMDALFKIDWPVVWDSTVSINFISKLNAILKANNLWDEFNMTFKGKEIYSWIHSWTKKVPLDESIDRTIFEFPRQTCNPYESNAGDFVRYVFAIFRHYNDYVGKNDKFHEEEELEQHLQASFPHLYESLAYGARELRSKEGLKIRGNMTKL